MKLNFYSTMINRCDVYCVSISSSIKPHTKVTNNAWLLTDTLCGFLSLDPASSDSFAFETIWNVLNANFHLTIHDFRKLKHKSWDNGTHKSLCSSDVFLPCYYNRKTVDLLSQENCLRENIFNYFFAFVIHKKKRPRQPLNQDLLPMRRLDLLSTHNSWFIFHLSEKFSFCASRALGLKGGRGWVAFYCSWKADTLYLIDGEFEHWRNVCACNHCKLS